MWEKKYILEQMIWEIHFEKMHTSAVNIKSEQYYYKSNSHSITGWETFNLRIN